MSATPEQVAASMPPLTDAQVARVATLLALATQPSVAASGEAA